MKTLTLEERCDKRYLKRHEKGKPTYGETHVRAELNRLARQVGKIRKEVNSPKCEIDSGYRLALTDVLALIKQAKR